MPRVPVVSVLGVADASLQTPMQRTAASPELLHNPQFGALVGAAKDLAAEIQDRTDTDAVMRAEAAVKRDYLEWEAEARQRRGEQAFGLTQDADKWWRKAMEKARQGLAGPRQRDAFDKVLAPAITQSRGHVSEHEATQRRVSLDASAQASIATAQDWAAANATNPTAIEAARADVLNRNQARAVANGWPAEVAQAQLVADMTKLHQNVIQSLVQADPGNAAAYFEKFKGEIAGTQHAEIGAFATKATANSLGNRAAADVWDRMGPKTDRSAVELDRMEEAVRGRANLSDEAKQSAIAGLRERAIAFKDSRRERDDQLEASVNKAILDGASSAQVRRMPEFMRLSPEAGRKIATYLENQEYTRLQRGNAALQRGELEAARDQRRLQREGMAEFLRLSDPQVLTGMTEAQVINLLPTLGNEHTAHLMQKRRELANPAKLAEARMDEDDFRHVAQQVGLKPFEAAGKPDRQAQLGELKYRVEQMISATQQSARRVLTRDEKLQLMRNEMARTRDRGHLGAVERSGARDPVDA